jgi:hypothetical protein
MGREWLEQSVSDPLVLSLILQPAASERLEAYQVSTLVNSRDNDSPECVPRVSQKLTERTIVILTGHFLSALAANSLLMEQNPTTEMLNRQRKSWYIF